MTKYAGVIHLRIEAKDWEEACKVLDGIVNAKLPEEILNKVESMGWDGSDFYEYGEEEKYYEEKETTKQ